jgi:hypothetical protein
MTLVNEAKMNEQKTIVPLSETWRSKRREIKLSCSKLCQSSTVQLFCCFFEQVKFCDVKKQNATFFYKYPAQNTQTHLFFISQNLFNSTRFQMFASCRNEKFDKNSFKLSHFFIIFFIFLTSFPSFHSNSLQGNRSDLNFLLSTINSQKFKILKCV